MQQNPAESGTSYNAAESACQLGLPTSEYRLSSGSARMRAQRWPTTAAPVRLSWDSMAKIWRGEGGQGGGRREWVGGWVGCVAWGTLAVSAV